MKKRLTLFVLCCTALFLFSCGSKQEIVEGVKQGMYEGMNQTQQMKQEDYPTPESGRQPPTYEQYKRERQEIIKDTDN